MNKEKQRIAIAEACGWTEIDFRRFARAGCAGDEWSGKHPRISSEHFIELPDYLNDLNACAEMEATLIFSKRQEYFERLQIVMSNNLINGLVSPLQCITATAEQKCQAFLKTIEKWEES